LNFVQAFAMTHQQQVIASNSTALRSILSRGNWADAGRISASPDS
jgi:hypothetical protein